MKKIERKTKRMTEVEQYIGEPLEEYLRRRFVDDQITMPELANELGIAYPMVGKWLEQAGVYSRRLGIWKDYTQKEQG